MAGYPELREALVESHQVDELIHTSAVRENRIYSILKRIVDVAVALALLILFQLFGRGS